VATINVPNGFAPPPPGPWWGANQPPPRLPEAFYPQGYRSPMSGGILPQTPDPGRGVGGPADYELPQYKTGLPATQGRNIVPVELPKLSPLVAQPPAGNIPSALAGLAGGPVGPTLAYMLYSTPAETGTLPSYLSGVMPQHPASTGAMPAPPHVASPIPDFGAAPNPPIAASSPAMVGTPPVAAGPATGAFHTTPGYGQAQPAPPDGTFHLGSAPPASPLAGWLTRPGANVGSWQPGASASTGPSAVFPSGVPVAPVVAGAAAPSLWSRITGAPAATALAATTPAASAAPVVSAPSVPGQAPTGAWVPNNLQDVMHHGSIKSWRDMLGWSQAFPHAGPMDQIMQSRLGYVNKVFDNLIKGIRGKYTGDELARQIMEADSQRNAALGALTGDLLKYGIGLNSISNNPLLANNPALPRMQDQDIQ